MESKLVFSGRTVLSDELFSGVDYKQVVNSQENYSIGTVACAQIQFTSMVIDFKYIGKWCDYYTKQWCDSDWRLIGRFKVIDVTRTKSTYIAQAYDGISDFDNDDNRVNTFMSTRNYPITLKDLLSQLCTYFGHSLNSDSQTFVNSDFVVNENPLEDRETITGRQLLTYIAEIAGGFIYAREDNTISVGYFKDQQRYRTKLDAPTFIDIDEDYLTIEIPDNALGAKVYLYSREQKLNVYINEDGEVVPYIDGVFDFDNSKYVSFDYQDYMVPSINYVHIGKTANDRGVSSGNSTTKKNVLELVGNPFLEINDRENSTQLDIQRVCDNIYEVVRYVTYMPSEVSLLTDYEYACGDIVSIDTGDPDIGYIKTYIMEKTITNGGATYSCKGTFTRENGKVYTYDDRNEATSSDLGGYGGGGDAQQVDIDNLYDICDDLQRQIDEGGGGSEPNPYVVNVVTGENNELIFTIKINGTTQELTYAPSSLFAVFG